MNGRYPRRSAIGTCVALGCLALAIVSCASPNPKLYTIGAGPGRCCRAGPRWSRCIRLRLPRYLERSQIVRSSENYRLDVLANDWWGEPLGAMLSRVLVEELSQRLPRSTVYADSGAVSATPTPRSSSTSSGSTPTPPATSCSGAGGGGVQAAADIGRYGSFRFVDAARRRTASPAEVAAISTAVGQLADGLAACLARPAAVTLACAAMRRRRPESAVCANARAAGCSRSCRRSRPA